MSATKPLCLFRNRSNFVGNHRAGKVVHGHILHFSSWCYKRDTRSQYINGVPLPYGFSYSEESSSQIIWTRTSTLNHILQAGLSLGA